MKLLKEVEQFSNEFSIDELVNRRILILKIEKGIQQSESGSVISENEMNFEIREWFK
jgi:hypothetical protein